MNKENGKSNQPMSATKIEWFVDDDLQVELVKKRNEKRKERLDNALVVCTGCAGNIEKQIAGELDDAARLQVLRFVFDMWSYLEDAFHPHPDERLRFYGRVGCRVGEHQLEIEKKCVPKMADPDSKEV